MAVIRGAWGSANWRNGLGERDLWGQPAEPLSGVVALYSPANSRHNGRDTDHDLIEASHRPLKQIHMKILPDKFRGQAEWRRNGQAGYEFHKQSGLVIGGRLYRFILV